MNPPPISKELLAEILDEAVAQLPPDLLEQYNGLKVAPYTVRVRYNGTPENEHAFWVVGQRGPKLLMYDDVEEYFSTGALDSDGIVREWDNIGPQDRLDGAVADLTSTK